MVLVDPKGVLFSNVYWEGRFDYPSIRDMLHEKMLV